MYMVTTTHGELDIEINLVPHGKRVTQTNWGG